MKNKIIIAISCVFAFAIVLFCAWMCIICNAFTPNKKYKKMADRHAQIDYFLNLKKDYDYLVVGDLRESIFTNGMYYIDESDSLYFLLKDIDYLEVDNSQKGDILYEFFWAIKISELGQDYQNERIASQHQVDDVEIRIYDDKTLVVSAYIDAGLNSTHGNRCYQLNDEDYNKLIKKLQLVVDDGLLYE